MTTTYILANWKANKSLATARQWLEIFLDLYEPTPGLQVVVAPPAPFLAPLKEFITSSGKAAISLAVQDISPYPLGSYTGALPADMMAALVDYVIVGHSERRRYFHETHLDVANKVSEAQGAGLTPILCLDLPYAQEQMAALDSASLEQDLLVGYGPVYAINQHVPSDVTENISDIAKIKKICGDLPLLFGGSVGPGNSAGYLELPELAGLMVASASLDPREFANVCRIARRPGVSV